MRNSCVQIMTSESVAAGINNYSNKTCTEKLYAQYIGTLNLDAIVGLKFNPYL